MKEGGRRDTQSLDLILAVPVGTSQDKEDCSSRVNIRRLHNFFTFYMGAAMICLRLSELGGVVPSCFTLSR